jgi:GTP cyclohydrolase I
MPTAAGEESSWNFQGYEFSFNSQRAFQSPGAIMDLYEHQRWNAAEVEQDTFSEHDWRRLLSHLGEDPNRQGLIDTPKRVDKAWRHWTSGYGQNPADILKVFEDGAEQYNELIVVRGIPVYSHCEHHLAPFFGTASIGYTPSGKIVGLSKLTRLVECFAKRLQVQERLTMQIAEALMAHVAPLSVGVVIRCRHMCMESRGIQTIGEETVTSALLGEMRKNLGLRSEFLALAQQQK